METCVLIPQEFSLAINALTNNNETDLTVWTCSDIPKGQLFYPFQGTIRIDKLNIASSLQDDDIRYQFGLYDEIATMLGKEVHHCNWIRFLRISNTFDSNVNMVCTKLKGEPIYETIKMIANNQELVVFYLPQRPEQHLFSEMRTSLYRHAIDSILQDTPLDLSTSLIHREVLPVSPASTSEDEHKSTSSESFGSITSLHVVENLVTSNGNKNLNCSLKTQTPRKSTRVSRGERSLLPCSVCGKTFDRPSLLKRHMRTHTGEKPHVCVVCGKGFSTSSSLNTHRRIHSGEKPHECQVCGKRFTASSNLYYHRMTHIKEKPHKCNLCSKSFPTPGDLKSHMYVHSGSWPFKCHICFRGFSKQTNLKNHLFLHTGDKPHICELCNKKFALACNLRAHLKTHEGEQQDECVRCGKVYLAAVNAKQKGICLRCFESNKLIDVTKTGFQYDVELATEDDSSNDSNELSDK